VSDYGVLLQQVINGLSLGAMYALLALGFTLVYGILELINFAHFNVFMVSSFVGMWALELLGISGQSHVLTGLALAGALLFANRRRQSPGRVGSNPSGQLCFVRKSGFYLVWLDKCLV